MTKCLDISFALPSLCSKIYAKSKFSLKVCFMGTTTNFKNKRAGMQQSLKKVNSYKDIAKWTQFFWCQTDRKQGIFLFENYPHL